MEELNLNVNQFPGLTWNFLGINRAEFFFKCEKNAVPQTEEISGSIKKREEIFCGEEIQTGLGKEFDGAFDSAKKRLCISTTIFCAAENSADGFAKIEFDASQNKNSAADFFIHAEKNSRSVFLFSVKGSAGSENFFGARFKIRAEENSSVKIFLANLSESGAVFFSSLGSECADSALVETTEISLGGGKNFLGEFHNLSGRKSSFAGKSSFILGGKNFLDMNQVVCQRGKNSASKFEVDGVLLDDAKKIWRGTIDFKNGCTESTGDEQEDVLLLGERVVNKSLPVILCDEENVEGRHGCSIGRLDEKKLFYMQSRGVDEKSARTLLAKAKVSKVSRLIPDEKLRNEIDSFVEKIL
jgi:Fe-S cluster assembly scaffold protein SufB